MVLRPTDYCAPLSKVLHTANGESFTCASCGATEGAFVRYEQLGDHCERCALSCCGCGEATEAHDRMMCGDCRPHHELTEDAAGRVCWGVRPAAIKVQTKRVRIGRVSVRRDVLSRALQAADRADTQLLMEHGWAPYGRHGWWRKERVGASTTKAGALAQVRDELRRSG